MTTSERTYQQLKDHLEQEHTLLAKELKHEMLLNTLVPSATAIEQADLNELIMMAKSSFIPNLFDLAMRMEKSRCRGLLDQAGHVWIVCGL